MSSGVFQMRNHQRLISARNREENEVTSGNIGMVNVGNTCYFNSAFQCMSHLYVFRDYLFAKEEETIALLLVNAPRNCADQKFFSPDYINKAIPDELKNKLKSVNYDPAKLSQEEKTIIINCSVTGQTIKLMKKIWDEGYPRGAYIDPISFRKIFSEVRKRFFFGNNQHDAEEAYSCIIQRIQEETAVTGKITFECDEKTHQLLVYKNGVKEKYKTITNPNEKEKIDKEYLAKIGACPRENLILKSFRNMKDYYQKNKSIITDLFSGFFYHGTECPECKYSSDRFDPFLHIPISVTGSTLSECLQGLCTSEKLDGENTWKCDNCGKNVRAVKHTSLWRHPCILVIQLKKYSNRSRKMYSNIDYPLVDLDISKFIHPVNYDKDRTYKYDLHGVINHIGGLEGGHYYAYCKHEHNCKWYRFDDTKISQMPEQSVVSSSAYALFYVRKDTFNEQEIKKE